MTLLGPKWDCISPLLFSLRWFPTALQGSPHLPISSAASLFSLSSSHTRLLSPICQAQSCLREFASAVPSALSFPHGLLPHFLQALAQMSFSEKDLGPLQVVGAPLPALFLFPASHQLALLVCFFSVSPPLAPFSCQSTHVSYPVLSPSGCLHFLFRATLLTYHLYFYFYILIN